MLLAGDMFTAAGGVVLLGCCCPGLLVVVMKPERPPLDEDVARWDAALPWLVGVMSVSFVAVWVLLALALTRRRFRPPEQVRRGEDS